MNNTRHNGETLVQEFRCILLVKNLSAQRGFYEDIFDWPIVNNWGGGVLYDTGTAIFELIEDAHADKPNGSSRLSLSVRDVWSLYDRIKNNVTIVFPPRNNSWGDTSFRIKDPDGFLITLFTPTKRK